MNKVNIQGLDGKLTKIYGDECEKNVVGIVIFNNDGKFFFDSEFKNQLSDEEVEALLLRGAVVDRGGKYYRPSSFNSEKVSFSDAVVNPEDIEVDLSGYVTKDELEEAIENIDIPSSGGGVVNNYWAGKKMVVNGDSVAYGSALTSSMDAFPYKVAEQLGMEIINYSIGGTTIAKPTGAYEKCFVSKSDWDKAVANGEVDTSKKYLVNTETGAPRLYKIYSYSDGKWTAGSNASTSTARTPLSDRIGAMDKDADVVMIFCGSNDFYYNWTPFGDFETSKYRALESTPASTPASVSEPMVVSEDEFDMSVNLAKADGVQVYEHKQLTSSNGAFMDNDDAYVIKGIKITGGHKIYAPYARRCFYINKSGGIIKTVTFHDDVTNFTDTAPDNAVEFWLTTTYEYCPLENVAVYMSINSAILDGFDMENNLVKSDGVLFHENTMTGNASGTSEITPSDAYFTYENIPVIGGRKLYAPCGRGVWFKDADGDDISYSNFTNSGNNFTLYIPTSAAYISVVAKYEEISPEDFAVYMSTGSTSGGNTSGGNTGGDDTGETLVVGGNETYCDALHALCRYLLKTYKNKDIIFCTPIKRVQHKGESNGTWDCVYPEDKNNYGKTLEDYRDAMIKACEYYSIPCIDLYTLSGLNPHIDPDMFADTDGKHTHPTVEGHERLASVVVAQMKALRN